jgi:hypothetical protein
MTTSTTPDPLASLPAELRKVVSDYVQCVQEVVGSQALSLTLLGSAAAGTFAFGKHLIHNTLVLPAIDLDRLRQLAQAMPRFRKLSIASPLVLTPDYLRSSLDTFPLELLEMQQQHLTVLGEDCFQPLEFDAKFVRLQCERELKSMVLAMRQAVLMAEGDERRLFEQHVRAADGLMRILRGMLWLKGDRQARPASEVVQQIESAVSRPLPGIRTLLKSDRRASWADYCALHADLDALGSATDAW